MTVREAIKQMAAAGLEIYCKICTVDAVDEKARTVDCTPIDESAPLLGVNLQANQESEDGVVMFPAEDSYVLVAFTSESTAAVVLAEKVYKIALKIGETTVEITDGKIDFATANISARATNDELTLDVGEQTSAKFIDGQVDVTVAGIKARMTKEAITLNEGTLGGMVVSQKAADKLVALESDLNELKAILAAWAPAPQDGGAALKGAVSEWAAGMFVPTAAGELENEKVKH